MKTEIGPYGRAFPVGAGFRHCSAGPSGRIPSAHHHEMVKRNIGSEVASLFARFGKALGSME